MIVLDVPQGSPEWKLARLGIPTASNFGKILTATGKVSTQRVKYMYELAGEAVSGIPIERFTSYRMEQGNKLEEESRNVYEMNHQVEVQQVGLCYKDEKGMYSCSPDGLIEPGGGFETKDAQYDIQVERLLKGKMVTSHIPQVQGCLFICGREWWDFQSYCRGLPPLTIRAERDETYISRLEEELEKFCYELVGIVKRLKELQ